MTNIVNTGNASVDALAEMSISGNVTPVNWYKTILRENGKPYLLAICVLSEKSFERICYRKPTMILPSSLENHGEV